MTGAPVRSASVASAEVVEAGWLKNSTVTASTGLDVLVDHGRHALVGFERAQDAAHGPTPVDHAIAGAAARALEQSVQVAGCRAGRASTDIGGSASACAMPCSSQ